MYQFLRYPYEMIYIKSCVKDYIFLQVYNLGDPSMQVNVDKTCQAGTYKAVSFGIDTNFLIAILICIVVLISKYTPLRHIWTYAAKLLTRQQPEPPRRLPGVYSPSRYY